MILEVSMNNWIQIFEHGKLCVNENGFKEHHFKKLVKLNERHGNKYFSVGNNRIYFAQYVGVIQVGNLIIEVLPKADSGDGDEDKWQRAFISMLRQSGLLKVDAPTNANLQLRRNSLLDLFFEQFLDEIKHIIHKGLVKKYRSKKENSGALKGKLLFPEHIQNNLIHKEKFYIQHQVYDHNNIFNQIIYEALKVVSTISLNSKLDNTAKKYLLEFEAISNIKVNDEIFTRLKFNRKTNEYKKAISLAKMILLNYSPDIQGGQDNLLSLLFDMNRVFEKYIYVQLKKAQSQFKDHSLTVSAQQQKKFWQDKTIRPDIVIDYTQNHISTKVIIDTKWKVLSCANPSAEDLKQMYAYNLHFGANQSYLVYPNVNNFTIKGGYFNKSAGVKKEYSKHSCDLLFVELFDDNGHLRDNLGSRIINNIVNN
jgi:5-methylcytosine-specific restriction enzyme subunit McrC